MAGNVWFLSQGLVEASQFFSQQIACLMGLFATLGGWLKKPMFSFQTLHLRHTPLLFSTPAPYSFVYFLIICLSNQKLESMRAEALFCWSFEFPAPEYSLNG